MPNILFRRADGQSFGGALHDIPTHDAATHVVIALPAYPDPRTERWDGAAGVRPATAQEIADHDAATLARATARIDNLTADNAFERGLIRVLAQRFGVTPAQLIAAIKAAA